MIGCIRKAWHGARNRKVVKKTMADGTVVRTVSMAEGPGLREWAREQVKSSGPFGAECDQWLNEHKSGKLEKEAKALRKKEKGGLLAQIASATKSAKKSKKKGSSAPATDKK